MNSKGLIPLTCQGNSSHVDERNVGTRNISCIHFLYHTRTPQDSSVPGAKPGFLESSLERTLPPCSLGRAVVP